MMIKHYKPLLCFDLTEKEFKTEEEFSSLIQRYPSETVVLVTSEQKKKIACFSGNSTRYMDATGAPLYTQRDALVYDNSENSVIVATGRDLDGIGETFLESDGTQVQSYIGLGMKMAFDAMKKE